MARPHEASENIMSLRLSKTSTFARLFAKQPVLLGGFLLCKEAE